MNFSLHCIVCLEPLNLLGEGSYNLNVVKEVKTTDHFLDMDLKDRGCQDDVPFEKCTTSKTLDAMFHKCQCLPLHLNKERKVSKR